MLGTLHVRSRHLHVRSRHLHVSMSGLSQMANTDTFAEEAGFCIQPYCWCVRGM